MALVQTLFTKQVTFTGSRRHLWGTIILLGARVGTRRAVMRLPLSFRSVVTVAGTRQGKAEPRQV